MTATAASSVSPGFLKKLAASSLDLCLSSSALCASISLRRRLSTIPGWEVM